MLCDSDMLTTKHASAKVGNFVAIFESASFVRNIRYDANSDFVMFINNVLYNLRYTNKLVEICSCYKYVFAQIRNADIITYLKFS